MDMIQTRSTASIAATSCSESHFLIAYFDRRSAWPLPANFVDAVHLVDFDGGESSHEGDVCMLFVVNAFRARPAYCRSVLRTDSVRMLIFGGW